MDCIIYSGPTGKSCNGESIFTVLPTCHCVRSSKISQDLLYQQQQSSIQPAKLNAGQYSFLITFIHFLSCRATSSKKTLLTTVSSRGFRCSAKDGNSIHSTSLIRRDHDTRMEFSNSVHNNNSAKNPTSAPLLQSTPPGQGHLEE